jgi:heterodisulfide reductase subunit A-like polyferredoxin
VKSSGTFAAAGGLFLSTSETGSTTERRSGQTIEIVGGGVAGLIAAIEAAERTTTRNAIAKTGGRCSE